MENINVCLCMYVCWQSIQWLSRHFSLNQKCQPLGGARRKVRGLPKSLGFILWEPWISVPIPCNLSNSSRGNPKAVQNVMVIKRLHFSATSGRVCHWMALLADNSDWKLIELVCDDIFYFNKVEKIYNNPYHLVEGVLISGISCCIICLEGKTCKLSVILLISNVWRLCTHTLHFP